VLVACAGSIEIFDYCFRSALLMPILKRAGVF
jgi:hypothetical protein